MGHQIVVLGDGQRDARDVGLLKRIGADELASHLTGDAHDRGGIEHRRGDAGDHVGGARSRGRDGDTDLPTGSRVAIRHVRGALFVPHQHVMDLAVLQGVIGRQDRAAGIAEHVPHALSFETLPQYAGSGHASCWHRRFVLHANSLRLLKSKTHRASVSGGAGFGSL